jgi:hypothetical protein
MCQKDQAKAAMFHTKTGLKVVQDLLCWPRVFLVSIMSLNELTVKTVLLRNKMVAI